VHDNAYLSSRTPAGVVVEGVESARLARPSDIETGSVAIHLKLPAARNRWLLPGRDSPPRGAVPGGAQGPTEARLFLPIAKLDILTATSARTEWRCPRVAERMRELDTESPVVWPAWCYTGELNDR